jgi:hypothetical protein
MEVRQIAALALLGAILFGLILAWRYATRERRASKRAHRRWLAHKRDEADSRTGS